MVNKWFVMKKRRKPYRSIVRRVIGKVDIVLEVLDARFPAETRSEELEEYAKGMGKVVILVLNKCDMVPKVAVERVKKELAAHFPCVFVSSTKKLGTKKLRDLIRREAPHLPTKVGIIGYPNVGKSQLSNALKGKGSAAVAPVPGYTKGVQWLRVSKNILLYDTPGVIGRRETERELVLKGAIEADACKDQVGCAEAILRRAGRDAVEERYGVSWAGGTLLEKIARRRGKLLKGGVADERAAAVIVIRDWYKGRLKKGNSGIKKV